MCDSLGKKIPLLKSVNSTSRNKRSKGEETWWL